LTVADAYALKAWDMTLTADEVNERVEDLTARLRRHWQQDPRPIAVFARNSGQTLIAFLATVLSGATFIPLNVHLGADELVAMLGDADAGTIMAGPGQLVTAIQAAERLPGLRVLGWGEPATAGYTSLADLPEGDRSEGDEVMLSIPMLFSSGTTGRAKRVVMPPILFPGVISRAEFRAWAVKSRFVGLGPHLVAGPLYHSGPMQATWLLAAGTPVVIPRRFDAVEVLAIIERERIATTLMVPTHFIRLLKARDEADRSYDISSIRHVTQTGAGCPDDVKLQMIDWWGPIFLETYGGTESGGVCFISTPEWLTHQGSVGRTLPHYDVLVVDDEGTELPRGREGKIYFADRTGRGIRYEDELELTAAAHLRPGVFTLGEIGRVDEEGYVYLTDRDSDKVVSGGVNLYPAEAENVLATHPAVADVAAIGVEHPEMGEELRALVVLRPGATANEVELIDYARTNLSSLKAPRSVLFVDDLERSPMGKLNRRLLRGRYAAVPAGTGGH
jgi:long-chain acyl-CoA synthetase